MKQGQETNQIWTQEAGTDDTHNRTLTVKVTVVFLFAVVYLPIFITFALGHASK